MNFFGFSALLNALTSFGIGIFVFIKNPKDPRNITFSLMCLSIFIWSFFYFLWQLATNASIALFLVRGLMMGSIFIPALYLNTVFLTFGIKDKNWILYLQYIFAFSMCGLNFTSGFVKSVSPKLCFQFWPNPGIWYHSFLFLWFLTVIYGLYTIGKIYANSTGLRKIQAKYFFLAALIGWVGGTTSFFLWYNIPILPYGNIFVSGYVVLFAYAIFRHQLMDINVVIRKTAIYSILATIITIAYFLAIYIVEGLFRGFMGYKSIPWTLSVIVIFTLIFQPLKDLIQNFVDKYFFKASQSALKEELIKAQDELKRAERLKAVGTLAAGMAHEIKNPLTGIKTFTEFLPQKHADPGFLEQFHDLVTAEVNKINDIVQQLLDFSKPKILKLEFTNINTLIDQTLSFLNSELINHNIKTVRQYDTAVPLLNIDPNQVKQVLLNLFLNSKDAMPKGGTLTITTKLINNIAQIIIQDAGIGMSKKDLEHIFDPFYSTKDTGTGLGMSIVYGIIKEHGGEITVESEIGNGAAFTIKLPIIQTTS